MLLPHSTFYDSKFSKLRDDLCWYIKGTFNKMICIASVFRVVIGWFQSVSPAWRQVITSANSWLVINFTPTKKVEFESQFKNLLLEILPMKIMPSVKIKLQCIYSLIARFMGPTWGPYGADRTQVGPMLAPWTLLSGFVDPDTSAARVLSLGNQDQFW